MQKNTRNALIVTAVFAGIVIPLYAFSVIGLAALVSAALIFSGLLILDFVRMRGKRAGNTLPVASPISIPIPISITDVIDANPSQPEPGPAPEPIQLQPEPQPEPGPVPQPAQPPQPQPVLHSKPKPPQVTPQPTPPPSPPTDAELKAKLEAKLAAFQKNMEEGRRNMMQAAIMYALKTPNSNHYSMDAFVRSDVCTNYLVGRVEKDSCSFLRSELERIKQHPYLVPGERVTVTNPRESRPKEHEELVKVQLIAIYTFYHTIFSFERELQNNLTQLKNSNKYRQVNLDRLSNLTLLPNTANLVEEFSNEKKAVQGILNDSDLDIDTLFQTKQMDIQTWIADQGKLALEIQDLILDPRARKEAEEAAAELAKKAADAKSGPAR